jgi:hypothetical protein
LRKRGRNSKVEGGSRGREKGEREEGRKRKKKEGHR